MGKVYFKENVKSKQFLYLGKQILPFKKNQRLIFKIFINTLVNSIIWNWNIQNMIVSNWNPLIVDKFFVWSLQNKKNKKICKILKFP